MPTPKTELAQLDQDRIFELASQGDTFKQICTDLRISPNTLFRLRRENPQFRQLLDDAMFEASAMVVEELRDIPYIETDAPLARVKIDALCRYLELRWPSRYGKQVNVNVKVLDMRDAIDKARRRSQAQVIDMYPNKDNVYTDRQSLYTEQSTSIAIAQSIDNAVYSELTLDDMLQ